MTHAPDLQAGDAWHSLELDDVAGRLGADPSAGLSGDEAARRLDESGPNELETTQGTSPWQLLLDQVKNVMILILLIAVGLSIGLGQGTEAIVIAVIVLFAVLLGFAQEYRAERAIEALREMAAPTATVLRDGEPEDVLAREIVPGDVMLLEAGDRAPADGRLIEVVSLQVEEAALTGESLPVEKQTAALPEGDAAGRRPAQHGLLGDDRHLWPRPRARRGDGDARPSSAGSRSCCRRSSARRRRCSSASTRSGWRSRGSPWSWCCSSSRWGSCAASRSSRC